MSSAVQHVPVGAWEGQGQLYRSVVFDKSAEGKRRVPFRRERRQEQRCTHGNAQTFGVNKPGNLVGAHSRGEGKEQWNKKTGRTEVGD